MKSVEQRVLALQKQLLEQLRNLEVKMHQYQIQMAGLGKRIRGKWKMEKLDKILLQMEEETGSAGKRRTRGERKLNDRRGTGVRWIQNAILNGGHLIAAFKYFVKCL